jgi:hypothetical protein
MQATWTHTVSCRTSEQVTRERPMDGCDWCGAYLQAIGRMGKLQGNALAVQLRERASQGSLSRSSRGTSSPRQAVSINHFFCLPLPNKKDLNGTVLPQHSTQAHLLKLNATQIKMVSANLLPSRMLQLTTLRASASLLASLKAPREYVARVSPYHEHID